MREGMRMKKLIALAMMFMMAMGTMVFAGEEGEYKETKVRTEKGKLTFSVEAQIHKIDCRCIPDPKIKIYLPEGQEFRHDKLYFELRGNEKIIFDTTMDMEPGVICVDLQDAEEDFLQVVPEIWTERGVQKGDKVSLWLLGGDKWQDNLQKGKKDVLLRENFLELDAYETVSVPKEVILTVGADTFLWNGETKHLFEPIRRNAQGQIMVAAKDLSMVMEGATVPQGNIQWNENTKTATLIIGSRLITMTDGNTRWFYLGHEVKAKTAPEIVDGVMYFPLREMAGIFNYPIIEWNSDTQTVRLYKA